MSWCKKNKKQWKEIIETVSREIERDKMLVEKDTIQSMFLLQLSQAKLPFVFKGGTSLSKGYDLINRFSEDIDLSMTRKLTESEKKISKEIIINSAYKIGMKLKNPDEIKSRYSYNKYIFQYQWLFEKNLVEMIVETNFYNKAYPVEEHKIGSLVGKFCEDNNIEMPISFEASNIFMDVQSLERTFIDKVFAVCDYRIQNMQNRNSRHLYDIYKIIEHIKFDKKLDQLIDKVREDRMLAKNNPSAQLKYNIKEILNEIIQSRFYESDYNSVTKRLLYEDVDYDHVVENGIAKVVKSDMFLYKNE